MDGSPVKNGQRRVEAMLDLQNHRGPDDKGVVLSDDGRLALGNVRLAIVDTERKLPVPFKKSDSGDMMSFNGEIYNFFELRRELEKKGKKFITKSDTEVLFEAIRVFGSRVYSQLDGIWAFAFYNSQTKSLSLSRDCLGERHLFYYINNNELVFASEPSAIIAVTEGLELNFDSLPAIWMYNTAPQGESLVKNLNRLLPGEELTIRNNKRESKIQQLLEPNTWDDYFLRNPSLEDVSEIFSSLMQNSIDARVPREVAFVSTLSGGLDSTVLNSFLVSTTKNFSALHGVSQRIIDTETAGSLSEKDAAIYTADKLGIELLTFNMLDDDPVNMLFDAANNVFDGCIDDGVVPFSMLAKYARKTDCKVALISDGPDEFAGGYRIDKLLHTIDKRTKNNQKVLSFLQFLKKSPFLNALIGNFSDEFRRLPDDLRYEPFRSPVNHQSHQMSYLKQLFCETAMENMYDHYGTIPHYYDCDRSWDNGRKRSLSYASRTIPDIFNLRIDKAFMKYSIEVRLPFQEKKLAEFLISLPTWLKFGQGDTSKYLLRHIVETKIGRIISDRKKSGFAHHLWDDDDVFNDLNMASLVQNSALFDHSVFTSNFKATVCGQGSHRGQLWNAYCFAMAEQGLAKSMGKCV
jgi:asparagine synthase (glutamine-hydrolysing)